MKVNGEFLNLQTQITLANFLTTQNYSADKVAVELNGTIVPKTKFNSTTLKNSDEIEIVCFVGGG